MRAESFRPPVRLSGRYVGLVPIAREHRDGLVHAARDPEIARYLATDPGRTAPAVEQYIDAVIARQSDGSSLAFTVTAAPDARVVGVTCYLHIDRENESVEIGGTWLDSSVWRTPVNTEAKLLLFRHAFDTEGAHRVWLQTDLRNERSQRAIARLGATREGVLREDRRIREGYRRSSVVFSVLAGEWPGVQSRLERFLARPWPAETSAPA